MIHVVVRLGTAIVAVLSILCLWKDQDWSCEVFLMVPKSRSIFAPFLSLESYPQLTTRFPEKWSDKTYWKGGLFCVY